MFVMHVLLAAALGASLYVIYQLLREANKR